MASDRIQALNKLRRTVIMGDGERLKIITFFDASGLETTDHRRAVSCVAGPDRDGRWLAIGLNDFERATVH